MSKLVHARVKERRKQVVLADYRIIIRNVIFKFSNYGRPYYDDIVNGIRICTDARFSQYYSTNV